MDWLGNNLAISMYNTYFRLRVWQAKVLMCVVAMCVWNTLF